MPPTRASTFATSSTWFWTRPTGSSTWTLSRKSTKSYAQFQKYANDSVLMTQPRRYYWKYIIQTPQERQTQLFSATMTSKVAKLQRACLRDPVKVEVASKYTTVETLRQQYAFVPAKHKDVYLAYALTELSGSTSMIFTRTCDGTRRIALMLRNLGFGAVPIHGQMGQPKRLAALNKFKVGGWLVYGWYWRARRYVSPFHMLPIGWGTVHLGGNGCGQSRAGHPLGGRGHQLRRAAKQQGLCASGRADGPCGAKRAGVDHRHAV